MCRRLQPFNFLYESAETLFQVQDVGGLKVPMLELRVFRSRYWYKLKVSSRIGCTNQKAMAFDKRWLAALSVNLLGLFLLYEHPGSKVCRTRSPWRLQEPCLGSRQSPSWVILDLTEPRKIAFCRSPSYHCSKKSLPRFSKVHLVFLSDCQIFFPESAVSTCPFTRCWVLLGLRTKPLQQKNVVCNLQRCTQKSCGWRKVPELRHFAARCRAGAGACGLGGKERWP